MSYDYLGLVATAKRLINKFGRNVTLRIEEKSGSSFDPTIKNVDTTITAVQSKFRTDEIDGTVIQRADKLFLTYNEVKAENKIIDGGIIYSVINVDTIKPANDKILYKVQARK